ncbi:MAG: hypothetical protein ACRD0L_16750 [Acidimicrobiales bacterium]
MEDYERLIEVARRRLGARPVAPRRDLGGAEVQLSVRVPAGLRAAVAEVAALSNRSVTTFVTDVLSSAVAIETDPFAGLAADMTAHTRAVLGEAVRSGDYAAAAASVEAAERAT